MSGRPPQSPWLARELLRQLLPAEDREFLIGDLEETFDARLAAAGRSLRAARRWYWRATFNNAAVGGREPARNATALRTNDKETAP